jgi:hypothetical protein
VPPVYMNTKKIAVLLLLLLVVLVMVNVLDKRVTFQKHNDPQYRITEKYVKRFIG